MGSFTLWRQSRHLASRKRPPPSAHPYLMTAAAVVGALTVAAAVNRSLASKAERENPPTGGFIEIEGVRLHYIERGAGEPLILLHGNGSMIEDFETSGLIEKASATYRVIAFDRPGFGHSNRPRNVVWTPEKQAALISEALRRLEISEALVLGHSWGASVAIALALNFPSLVRGLVVASGYYYPSVRPDFFALSLPAAPVLGDIIGHTLAPLVSRMMWPGLLRKIFGPAAVPDKFAAFPKEMAFRPSQIRAAAAESALLVSEAFHFADRYPGLRMPVTIVAGSQDQLIDVETQSARLHGDIAQSKFRRVAGSGHMVHQTATDTVLEAIDETADSASPPKSTDNNREAARA